MSGGGGISLCNAVGRKGSKLEGIQDPLLGRRKPGALHKFWFAGQGAGVMVERMRRALGLCSVRASAAEAGGPGQANPRLCVSPAFASLCSSAALMGSKITGSLPRD